MKFWEIKASKSENEINLSIYGSIVDEKWLEGEVTALEIKKEIDNYPKAKKISIFINSGGGSVFAALAIYNMLKRNTAEKEVYIDGLAASAASVIAMVGDKVHMPKNSMLMIHNAWAFARGNSEEIMKIAELLEGIDSNMREIYAEKTGLDINKIAEMMNAETWMSAKEACKLKFCDIIEEEQKIAASILDGVLSINGLTIEAAEYKNFPTIKVEKVIKIEQEEHKPILVENVEITTEEINKYILEVTKNATSN